MSAKSGGLYQSTLMHKHNFQSRQTDRVRVGVKRCERMGNWRLVATVSDRLFRNEEMYKT